MSSSLFLWLDTDDDAYEIAKEIGKSAEELKKLRQKNVIDDKRTVFHVGSGEQRDLAQRSCDTYPRASLERLFMEDLHNKSEVVWEEPYGTVIRAEDFVAFHLWAKIQGVPYHQKFVADVADIDADPKLHNAILDRMVYQIDLNVKIFRYGPIL